MWLLAITIIVLYLAFAFDVNIVFNKGHIYFCYDGKHDRQIKKII